MAKAKAKSKFREILLLRGSDRADCVAAEAKLLAELLSSGTIVRRSPGEFSLKKTDLVLLLGGDGFLMESVRTLGYPPTPVFGVNFGSVGFLMNSRTCLEELPASLRASRFHAELHPVLEARVKLAVGGEESWRAVNDLILERAGGQSVHLVVQVDGLILNEFAGDGVIVATSAGSTAYNLAAGGPVLHPALPSLVLTPLYPHRAAPFNSLQFSVILPLGSSVTVRGIDIPKRPIRLLADGRPREGVEEVTVRDSGQRITLLRLETHQFISTLARKFIGSDG